jgi:hypothetical protein
MDEYQIGRAVLDELTAILPRTRGGAAVKAYMHPGTIAPQYGSCDGATAWGIITSIAPTSNFPVPASTPQHCGLGSEYVVAMTFGVYRCYERPRDNLELPPAQIDSQFRDILDDGRALRAAVTAVIYGNRGLTAVVGAWTPVGPAGDVYGSQLSARFRLDACPEFRGVDEDTPP